MSNTTEQAITLAYKAHDAGQHALCAKAMRLAIKAAGTDAHWLRVCKRHLGWMYPTH